MFLSHEQVGYIFRDLENKLTNGCTWQEKLARFIVKACLTSKAVPPAGDPQG
jgi:hypothetical protein